MLKVGVKFLSTLLMCMLLLVCGVSFAQAPGVDTCFDGTEPNDFIEQSTLLNLSTAGGAYSVSAVICPSGDVDYFAFRGVPGATVVADINAAVNGSALDSVLYLTDAAGSVIALNDDSNGTDSHLEQRLDSEGPFYLAVVDYVGEGGDSHFYTLSVSIRPGVPGEGEGEGEFGDDFFGEGEFEGEFEGGQECGDPHEPNDSLRGATPLHLPAGVEAGICPAGDVDYYRFQAQGGLTLVADIDAQVHGSSLDSVLLLLNDSGVVIAQNDDAHGLDSHLEFPIETDGEYLLAVLDFSSGGGSDFGYLLRVSQQAEAGEGEGEFEFEFEEGFEAGEFEFEFEFEFEGKPEGEASCISLQNPEVTITLDPNSVRSGDGVEITFTATDDMSIEDVSAMNVGTGVVLTTDELHLSGIGTHEVGGLASFTADLDPGTYQVTVTVTDNCGNEGKGSAILIVRRQETPTPGEGEGEGEQPTGGGGLTVSLPTVNICQGAKVTSPVALATQLDRLRAWRDSTLLGTRFGEKIAAVYYGLNKR